MTTAVPFLPKIRQPHRSSFPVFQKSHWKSHKKSPDLAARNSCQSPRAFQSPEALREKDSPGTFRNSENATNEQWSRAGDIQIKRRTEGEKKTLQRTPGATSHSRQQPAPSLSKICQPRHQCQSRDQMASTALTSVRSYAEAARAFVDPP